MNIKLLDSIATIINSLSTEERDFLKSKIKSKKTTKNYNTLPQNLLKTEERYSEPPLHEYINITRDERIAQQDELINSCFKSNKNSKYG